MSALVFDTLKYTRRLMEAGVPKQQAEVQAETMAEAFVFNVDALVTRDYLDARLGEQDARIETRFTEQDARIDQRFAEQDARIDKRFIEQDARIEQRFTEQDVRIDKRFAEIESGLVGLETRFDKRFAALDLRLERELGPVHKQLHLHSWILALVAASTVLPALSALLGY